MTPLLNLLQPGVASKPQVTSACFCLRKIIQFLIRDHRHMITFALVELITSTAFVSASKFVWHCAEI